MDTSAFEAVEESNLDVVELYHALPEDVQDTIRTILALAKSLAKIGLLVAAWTCCTVALGLLIAWICLFWVQTQLISYLSRSYKVLFDLDDDYGDSGRRGGKSPDKRFGNDGASDSLDGPANLADEDRGPNSTAPASADFDLFEAFLNSPKDSRGNSNLAEEKKNSQQSPNQTDERLLAPQEDSNKISVEEDQKHGVDATPVQDASPPKQSITHFDKENAMASSTERQPTWKYSTEQLNEAASFMAETTRGAPAGHHPRQNNAQRPRRLHQQTRAVQTAAPKTSPRVQSNGMSNALKPLTTKTNVRQIAVNGTDKTQEVVLSKSGILPPHLRKKQPAPGPRDDTDQSTIRDRIASTSTIKTDLESDNVESSVRNVRYDSNQDSNTQQASSEGEDLLQEEGTEAKSDGFGKAHVSIIDSAVHASPAVVQQDSDSTSKAPNVVGQRLTFDELLTMDQRECQQALANVTGDNSEQTAIRDKPDGTAIPLTKPAERAMSIERLKSFNIGPGSTKSVCGGKAINARLAWEAGVTDSQWSVHQCIDAAALGKLERLASLTYVQQTASVSSLASLATTPRTENRVQNTGMQDPEFTTDDIQITTRGDEDVAMETEQFAQERGTFSATEKQIPLVVVIPNTPTDEESQPTAKPCAMSSTAADEFQMTSGLKPRTITALSRPRHTFPTADRPDSSNQNRVDFNNSAKQVDAAESGREPTRGRQRDSSSRHVHRSRSRSSDRENALRQIVEVINKRTVKEYDSFSAETSTVDQATGSVNSNGLQDQAQTAQSEGHLHPDLQGLVFDVNEASREPSPPPPNVTPQSSLSAEAPAFQPPTTTTSSQNSPDLKTSGHLVSSLDAKCSTTGHSHSQTITTAMTSSLPSLSSDLVPRQMPMASVQDLCFDLHHSTLAGTANYDHSFVSTFSPFAPTWSNIQANRDALGHQMSNTGDSAYIQDINPDKFSSAQTLQSVPSFMIPVTSGDIPSVNLFAFSTSNDPPFSYLQSASLDGRNTHQAAPQGLLQAERASQQAFDDLLKKPGFGTETQSGTLSSSRKGSRRESDLNLLWHKVAALKATQWNEETWAPLNTPDEDYDTLGITKDIPKPALNINAPVFACSKLGNHGHVADSTKATPEYTAANAVIELGRDGTINSRFQWAGDQAGLLNAGRPDKSSATVRQDGSQISNPVKASEVEVQSFITGEIEDSNVHDESLQKPIHVSSAEWESVTTNKKKRRKARESLREAWREREEIRRRLLSTYTLDGARSLEYATKTYTVKRAELEQCMANHELNEEDAKEFPLLSKSDLSAPSKERQQASMQKLNKKTKMPEPKQIQHSENNMPPTLMTTAMLSTIAEEAIKARKSYEEAHDYLLRAPPQGRIRLRDARKPYETRIELAAKRYRKKIEAVEAAYPNGMPAWLARELWTFDEDASKRSRDETLNLSGVV